MSASEISPAITVQSSGGRVVVKITSPTIDFSVRETLGPELARHVRDQRDVVIDLSSVRYVDNLGFEALVTAVRACPGRLLFIGVTRPVRSLFTLAHLDTLIENS